MDWAALLDPIRYWVAVAFVVTVPPAIAWWMAIHPFARFWRRLGATRSLWILSVLFLGFVALLLPFRDLLLIRDLGFEPLLLLPGLLLLGSSAAIALRRKKHLTFPILAGLPEVSSDPEDSKLLDEGIYATIRHPRYVEFVLGGFGWALVLNYLGVYLLMVAGTLALHGIVLLEEQELRERFGRAYQEYAERVPRYVPRRR